MIWLFGSGLVIPWIFYFFDMLGNNFDAHFSHCTRNKLRVSDKSFLRKIIPLKEGEIMHQGRVIGYRYFLYIRAVPLFVQTVLIITSIPLFLIDVFVYDFMNNKVFGILGLVLIIIWVIHTVTINILSQGLHI